MICVSIGRGRHRHMIAEHRHLVEQGAQLVELRIDYIRRAVNLKRLIADRPCPAVITCRRKEDGGQWEGTEADRRVLLRMAIAEGVDYVDLESDVAPTIPRYGPTKRIISYHNFEETPEDLEELHQQMCGMDADIVKLATMANHPHDNVRMLRLVQQSRVPTVGLCMGDIGTPSRLLCGRFGAPFTYATFHHERALAPGQLSYRQMVSSYHYEAIGPDTEVFGVVADPVGHSLSPLIHNAAFRALGMNRIYLPFRVLREQLREFLLDCPILGVRGLSVTIPHKEEMLRHLTSMSDETRLIGATNTALRDGDQWSGHNTDYQAALDSIDAALEGPDTLQSRVCLVLGAGGAARAIATGLKQRGADVVLTNRTPARATMLADQIGARTVAWEDRHRTQAGLLVNCTPVGMHPNVNESPYKSQAIDRAALVFDTVYNPEQTLLIKESRTRGCRTITGVEMFVRQAALQFKLFTGEEVSLDLLREQMRRAIGAAQVGG